MLERHDVYDKFQPGFLSTETALLRVSNDSLMSSDAGECSELVLLDLCSAFDTIDHHILIKRLRDLVGTSGSALAGLQNISLTEVSLSV